MSLQFKTTYFLFVTLISGILIGYYFGQLMTITAISFPTFNIRDSQNNLLKLKSHVNIIDLNNQSDTNYTCIKSKKLFDLFQPTICLHDVNKDIYVSGTILREKIWEENLVTKFLRILLTNPDFAMIDIGANIGTYTIYSASIGRRTISIECYQPNIDRIVHAVQIDNVEKYVTLIGNAIYSESGKYLELTKDNSNIGGQELITNETSSVSDEFTVSTIHFDDLLPIFFNEQIHNAVLKIDIQSSEHFLCETGKKIFDSINIVLIQMEWVDIKWKEDRAELIIDFFTQRNYVARATNDCKLLDPMTSNYTTWGTPYDIYWIKSNYSDICKT